MVDGQFREKTYGAEYFSMQDFPINEFEVIFVEFYTKVPDHVREQKNVKVITLDNPDDRIYHSSFCFNRGIIEAKGDIIIIPDADTIVRPDFLSGIFAIHAAYENLALYCYRYDEAGPGKLESLAFWELEKNCILKNTMNYGGCLSVRKKWLLEINGYEQHKMMESGFHANGLDMYTRFKSYGMAIMWANPEKLKLFHPWHINTTVPAHQYQIQKSLIAWKLRNMQYLAINGIDPSKNNAYFNEEKFVRENHELIRSVI